jgi:hypothetical protein
MIVTNKKKLTQHESFEMMKKYVLDNFDFQKCHIVMKFLDWKWGFNGLTPTVDELKKTAIYLMDSAADGCLKSKECKPNETYLSATGGLKASVVKNKYNHLVYLNLEFILTDWDSDDDVDFP